MNETMNKDCGRALEQLDLLLDGELPDSDRQDVQEHIATCASCQLEISRRTAMQHRVRSAVKAVAAPEALAERIRRDVQRTPAPRHSQLRNWTAAVAASVMLVIGGAVAYELGHLRFTVSSQERYVSSLSERVSGIVRVGLGDHVHCAYFRKYPKQAPPVEQIAADMGPEFLPLVQLVREHIPAEQKITMAHRCRYHGRSFVHLTLVDGTHLTSLVVADRQPGETFENSGLRRAATDPALPIYQTNVQRFQIDGFQTQAHLVYLISDLGQVTSEGLMARLASPVNAFLTKLES